MACWSLFWGPIVLLNYQIAVPRRDSSNVKRASLKNGMIEELYWGNGKENRNCCIGFRV